MIELAASGSFNTTGFTDSGITRYLTFSWNEVSQSVANNTTTISWTLKGGGNGAGLYYKCQNVTVKIDGKVVFEHLMATDGQINLYADTTVATGTYTFTHADDGTKSFTAYAEAGIYSWPVNCTGSKTFTLDTIARASQPSCITWPEHTQNVGNFGDEISIHMNRKADTMTHTVRYQFGSQSGTIATGVTTGTTWVIPLSLMNLIPNATSGSGTIYVDTYNGSTKIGTKSCGFTATVPASVKPSLSVTLEDTTGTDDIYGSPVKGLSKIKITPTVTLAYSSPIATYTITANGVTYNTSTATTGFLNAAGSSKVTVTVKDKRGRSATWEYTMTVLDYTSPVVSNLTVKRCDADGTENDQGEYVQISFSAAISSMSSKNTATYVVRHKKSSDTTWTSLATGALNNKYTITDQTYVFAADGNYSYDVEVTATDRHGTTTRPTSVSTAFTLYNCHPSGTGWRFGGVADKEYTLQNNLDLVQQGNRYAYSTPGVAGTGGFIKMAQLTHLLANADTPITFVFTRRLEISPMTVHVQFKSKSTTVDPDLQGITYEGSNYGAFLVKSATSVWDLYVQKVSDYDTVTLQDWYSTGTIFGRLKVTFPGTLVQGTDPSVLGSYYRATPAKLQSLLDYIYPVGSIYYSYSHVSPAEMFGGTWTRIENKFLWATTSGGTIGGTGGEQTHTLTVSEMPKHRHSMNGLETDRLEGGYVAARSATFSQQTDDGTTYTEYEGSGAAHNNMPPYIQVSAWRRTA